MIIVIDLPWWYGSEIQADFHKKIMIMIIIGHDLSWLWKPGKHKIL
jgi:hypothetical protein